MSANALDLEPYVMLPAQVRRRTALAPEFALVAAVFEKALDDLKKLQNPASVLAWIRSEECTLPAAFSFRECCELLGLDVDEFRAALCRKYP